MESGAHVKAYDPIAMPDAQQELTGNVRYCDSAYSVAEGADALVLAQAGRNSARWILIAFAESFATRWWWTPRICSTVRA